MARHGVPLLLALALAAGAGALEAAGPSPVQRVVGLLQKMRSELEQEASKEGEMYDKMVCWCETGRKEKTRAIAEAEAKISQLTAEIEERSARFGGLAASIEQAKKEVAENTEALETAQALREKGAAQFREDEKDMVQAITNLRNAVSVLSKHQKALLQMDPSLFSGLRAVLRDCALKYEEATAGRAERGGARRTSLLALASATRSSADEATASLLSALTSHGDASAELLPLKFAERLIARAAKRAGAPKAFLQLSADGPPSYSSQSGGVYGVMTQMLDEFQEQLKALQVEESKSVEDFKALAATKSAEIEAGRKKLDEMQVQDAGNSKALSDAKEDLEETRNQRSEDVEFLQNLKLTCNDLDAQWEKRRDTRNAETKAVSEALVILTEDDNRETLARSVSLLQAQARTSRSMLRARAAAALRAAADADDDDLLDLWHGRASGAGLAAGAARPRVQLSALAMSVQRDSFTKVKEAMDTMVAELKKQQEEEVKFKDYCSKEMADNEKTTHEKSELKKDLESQMGLLETRVKQLREDISKAKAQLEATAQEVKSAGQAREAENAQFQATVSDQRATQTILKKALRKLKDFYEKGIGKAVFAQEARQTPPVQFNSYKAHEGASPVVSLLEQIIEDSVALEAEAVSGERTAQADYEKFVKEATALTKDLQAAVASKTEAAAAAKEEAAQAAEDRGSAASELQSLEQLAADLHAECDWSLKNFDVRQKARTQEINAIQSAKGILSGAK